MNLAKSLINGSTLTSSVATYYTVPAGATCRLTQASILNTDTVNRTVSIWVVASGGSTGVNNQRIRSKTLVPNESWVPFQILGKTMNAGTTIQVQADANSVVSMDASGIELTQ